jgi:hypothetical protein
MSAIEAVTDARKCAPSRAKRPRSAVTSGRKAFIAGDPNSAWARRFHDLVQGHISDLGARPLVSEAQFALCKRAAGLECELEQMEGRMSLGEEINLDSYGRAAVRVYVARRPSLRTHGKVVITSRSLRIGAGSIVAT